ncbi:MAG: hypothetical protein EBR38_09300 [Flavobacteriaceae bacterium]|nr:hypothetical protein [Flavobacteriaceae bacterium]
MSYTVVKASLNQFCNNEVLKSKINDIVLNANKIMFEAYCFANLHVLKCIEENQPLPQLNQSFFQKCCAFVSTMYNRKEAAKKDQDLSSTYELYKQCYPDRYKIAYRDNIAIVLNYISKDMAVATSNHLTLNFYKRFSSFLKAKYPTIPNDERYIICKDIYDKEYIGNNELVLEYRNKLGNIPPYENNIKKDPSYIISVYEEILNFNKSNGKRLFSLLPLKGGFQMSYITIDNSVLRDLIVGYKLKDCDKLTVLKEDIEANPRPYWEEFFNVKKYETSSRKFAMVKTDGKSVSIVLEIPDKIIRQQKNNRKTKKTIDTSCIPSEMFDHVIGLDPGLRNTFVGYNNFDDVIRCSGKEYYHSSGVNITNYKQQRCYNRNTEFMDFKANMPCAKTTSLTELQNFISYSLKGVDNALQLHHKNPFRKWKFKTYISKQNTFLNICKKISKKSHKTDTSVRTIVGFGDWSNPRDSIIRGHKRGPVKQIKEELKRWCPVMDVDEFRTSKLCCCCHSNCKKVLFDGKEVNSVLRCTNNECGITIDRDINGSKNIFMLFNKMLSGQARPSAFCR